MAQDLAALLDRYRGARRGSRDQRLRQEYGIDEATYEALLRSQGGVCAICHAAPQGQALCVDHDHVGGRIRGLLCATCNRSIGLLGDDPNLLRAAATYLDHGGVAGEQHQPKR